MKSRFFTVKVESTEPLTFARIKYLHGNQDIDNEKDRDIAAAELQTLLSSLPASAIIVGLGKEDLEALKALDRYDKERLRTLLLALPDSIAGSIAVSLDLVSDKRLGSFLYKFKGEWNDPLDKAIQGLVLAEKSVDEEKADVFSWMAEHFRDSPYYSMSLIFSVDPHTNKSHLITLLAEEKYRQVHDILRAATPSQYSIDSRLKSALFEHDETAIFSDLIRQIVHMDKTTEDTPHKKEALALMALMLNRLNIKFRKKNDFGALATIYAEDPAYVVSGPFLSLLIDYCTPEMSCFLRREKAESIKMRKLIVEDLDRHIQFYNRMFDELKADYGSNIDFDYNHEDKDNAEKNRRALEEFRNLIEKGHIEADPDFINERLWNLFKSEYEYHQKSDKRFFANLRGENVLCSRIRKHMMKNNLGSPEDIKFKALQESKEIISGQETMQPPAYLQQQEEAGTNKQISAAPARKKFVSVQEEKINSSILEHKVSPQVSGAHPMEEKLNAINFVGEQDVEQVEKNVEYDVEYGLHPPAEENSVPVEAEMSPPAYEDAVSNELSDDEEKKNVKEVQIDEHGFPVVPEAGLWKKKEMKEDEIDRDKVQDKRKIIKS